MNALHRDLVKLIEKTQEQYEASGMKQQYRLNFHLMPPVGWLNDPNGLCQFQGVYHVFFQYSPFNVMGGVKTWGHYISRDLLHWKYQGVPLVPDQPFDCHGVYSGSALIDEGRMELFYTGNVKYAGDFDYIVNGRGSNTVRIVSEDGINFGNKQLLLENKDYPQDYTCHIRDPKVWKDGEIYRMVLGARRKEDKGSVIFFESKDKQNWNFSKEISTEKPFGFMWECPDLFELDGMTVLSVSPQGLASEEYRFQNLYQSGYFAIQNEEQAKAADLVEEHGTGNAQWDITTLCNSKEKNYVCAEDFYEWDMGFDFYAPQTFLDEKGRRILIGWAGMPDVDDDYNNQPTVKEGWQHALTVPRELTRKGKRILQYPVEEMLALRERQTELEENRKIVLENGMFDLEIDNSELSDLVFNIDQELSFEYHHREGLAKLYFSGNMGSGRKLRQAKTGKVTHLRVLADTSLMEIYLNHGETVFTTRYYPKNKEITLMLEKGGSRNILWLIMSAHGEHDKL